MINSISITLQKKMYFTYSHTKKHYSVSFMCLKIQMCFWKPLKKSKQKQANETRCHPSSECMRHFPGSLRATSHRHCWNFSGLSLKTLKHSLCMICWQTQRRSLQFCHDLQETLKYMPVPFRGRRLARHSCYFWLVFIWGLEVSLPLSLIISWMKYKLLSFISFFLVFFFSPSSFLPPFIHPCPPLPSTSPSYMLPVCWSIISSSMIFFHIDFCFYFCPPFS